jgi:hypothetical protein
MAEVMSMIPDETPAGELNADEQESLQVGEQMEQEQEQRLAGKYKNAEELEAAYLELQKKFGESNNQTSEEQEVEEKSEDNTSILDRLWEEASSENISQETLDQLSKADPNDLAKMYLDYRSQTESSQKPGMSQQDVQQLKGLAGGEEKYTQMLRWASENLTEQEISMYDSIMDKGDPASAFFAVQALSYRYQDANGVEGNLVQGKSPGPGGVFRSQAELVQAMSDPRYDSDPAYRQDVMRKLDNSKINF